MKSPFSNSPLRSFPYNSRVSTNEFSSVLPSKNYVLIAFVPGTDLQASELNEIQDNFYKSTTLYNKLFRNWLFVGGTGFTSGGTGAVGGPSWVGAVPLDPTTTVGISSGIITFNKDWYLVDDPSGLKFWIYNNETLTITGTTNGYYGVGITHGYVSGTTADLTDNSGGYQGPNIVGADRYQINITEAKYFGATSGTLESDDRAILLKTGITYNYLNNLLKTGQ